MAFAHVHPKPCLILCIAVLLQACASAPRGALPASCSGVPGDLRTPGGGDAIVPPTHGPAGTGHAIELTAIARPATSDFIPLLYVFDDRGAHVVSGTPLAAKLTASAFRKVEAEAYWGEVSGDSYYQIPWLDACSQASMLREPLSFRAPVGGLLFVQYVAPLCSECAGLAIAIQGVIDANPALPVRWVRISVPPDIGSLTSH